MYFLSIENTAGGKVFRMIDNWIILHDFLERYSLKNEVPLFWNLRQRFEYFTSAAGADHHRTRKRGHCFSLSSENLSEDGQVECLSILSQLLLANKGVTFSSE